MGWWHGIRAPGISAFCNHDGLDGLGQAVGREHMIPPFIRSIRYKLHKPLRVPTACAQTNREHDFNTSPLLRKQLMHQHHCRRICTVIESVLFHDSFRPRVIDPTIFLPSPAIQSQSSLTYLVPSRIHPIPKMAKKGTSLLHFLLPNASCLPPPARPTHSVQLQITIQAQHFSAQKRKYQNTSTNPTHAHSKIPNDSRPPHLHGHDGVLPHVCPAESASPAEHDEV